MARRPRADERQTSQTPVWTATRPQTMVDHAVSAIIAGAARGVILPGDRIVESDLSKVLNMSRVPIREALRILESQGVVTSVPYQGIRLMDVTHERLVQILDVRENLEILATRRAIEAGANDRPGVEKLKKARHELKVRASLGDIYDFALADAQFHRVLVGRANNPVLSVLWESLARQMTIIVGLSTLGKTMKSIVEEHDVLIDTFASGDVGRMADELHDHIYVLSTSLDFDAIVAERKRQRQRQMEATP